MSDEEDKTLIDRRGFLGGVPAASVAAVVGAGGSASAAVASAATTNFYLQILNIRSFFKNQDQEPEFKYSRASFPKSALSHQERNVLFTPKGCSSEDFFFALSLLCKQTGYVRDLFSDPILSNLTLQDWASPEWEKAEADLLSARRTKKLKYSSFTLDAKLYISIEKGRREQVVNTLSELGIPLSTPFTEIPDLFAAKVTAACKQAAQNLYSADPMGFIQNALEFRKTAPLPRLYSLKTPSPYAPLLPAHIFEHIMAASSYKRGIEYKGRNTTFDRIFPLATDAAGNRMLHIALGSTEARAAIAAILGADKVQEMQNAGEMDIKDAESGIGTIITLDPSQYSIVEVAMQPKDRPETDTPAALAHCEDPKVAIETGELTPEGRQAEPVGAKRTT